MKRVGFFLLGFVPLGLSLLLQLVAGLLTGLLPQVFTLIPGVGPSRITYGQLTDLLQSPNANGTLGIIFALLCILIFGIWYYQTCGADYLPNVKKTFNLPSVTGTILLAPGFQFLSSIIMASIAILLPKALEQYQNLMNDAGMNEDVTIFLIIYSVVMAPISEELIFRGVTMRCFRRAVPFWLANILQAILFGVFHANLVQGIYTAFFALLLGYVCEYSGNIYYSILLHFSYNFWGVIVSQSLIKISEYLYLAVFGFMFIALVAGAFLFLHGQRKLHPERTSYLI